ncbi:phage gp6-like head-tail connector protein [Bacillus sp. A301a_S52]|jgi:uncharacterized phage protein (predicted DNA packaging)|nr:phage gp6-like head-tail connector protein [Bacillus sp. A301a_S52]UJW58745.1 phage gp6-like head-tail connector protein [Bacillus sp. A116_S68]
MDLENLKTFLRIDGSEDDGVLTSLISAGKSHLRQAGLQEPTIDVDADESEKSAQIEAREQYNLALMLYVKREYDPHTGLELQRMKETIEGIILQLREYGKGDEDDV